MSEIEEREEDIYAAEEHDDVAEEVHEFDFLEVVENDAHEIEGCTEDQHAEAFWREDFEEVLCNEKAGEACEDVKDYVELFVFFTGDCVEKNSYENEGPYDSEEDPACIALNLCDCVGAVAEAYDEEREHVRKAVEDLLCGDVCERVLEN